MNRKWVIIIAICSFLLGAGGVYGGLTWVAPLWADDADQLEVQVGDEDGLKGNLQKISHAYDIIRNAYVEKVEDEKLIQGAIQGMVGTLQDPYSVYMDAATTEQFNDSMDTSFDGIGAQISLKDGKLIIIAPIKNSPAEKAGIKAKDQITKIDGKSVDGLDAHQASLLIRGKKGTTVQLEIVRGDLANPLIFEITRDEIPLLTVYSEMKNNGDKNIGYIEITQFAKGTAKEFSTELKKLEKQGIEGLIIDVRGNPGGMLSSVEAIMRELVTGEKPYVQIEERSGKRVTYASDLKENKDYPISVLIDEGSASASEILAGALNEIEGYELIGEKTFGKGTVQQALPLDEHSQIKLTMAKWLTPNGNWIHGKGIEPTIEVQQPASFHVHSLQIEETLVKDMNNEKVKIAQNVLKALSFAPGRTDGYFDEQTEQAVRAFQSIHKLPITGQIDVKTALKMEEA